MGQEVEVEVLDVDLERERVSLSLKATQEDPWKEFERRYQAGEIIEGQVTKLVPFGAFVRVAPGHRGPGPHLRAEPRARRHAGVGAVGRRRGPREGDRRRRPAPPGQPVDAPGDGQAACHGDRGRGREEGARRPRRPSPRWRPRCSRCRRRSWTPSRKRRRPRRRRRRPSPPSRTPRRPWTRSPRSRRPRTPPPWKRRSSRWRARRRGGGAVEPVAEVAEVAAPEAEASEPEAPAEPAPAAEPEAETPPDEVSLEAILEDLKRREGRAE